MAWTYSGNPQASLVDEVHYRLGDTDPSNPLATDEECAFALQENRGNTYLSAADVAETKALQLALRPSTVKRGDRTTSYYAQAETFRALAATLRMQASLHTATVYAGGIDAGEKAATRQDQSLVTPFARKDLHTPLRGHVSTYEERDPL